MSQKDNLKETKRENQDDLLFLSRLPENFNLAKELKQRTWENEKWEKVGALVEGKDAAIYHITLVKSKLYGKTIAFL